ncbi:MAG: histidine phosphatase family protein [Paenibacillus sp.]|uniref:histidine phosphatase family protein n=1 Tax=Paenibacillus sp. TaxID=58172 RepID=UPI002902F28F|nr:histidine phosphatase family protein [Paenibacillus sp.]MDU2242538.1 histidine phosphatase family protein [Paenibacillus sp.]
MKPNAKDRIRLMGVAFLLLALWALPLSAEAGSAAASPPDRLPASLLANLRQGGYVIYVRHGEANLGEDRPGLRPEDCAAQRNLSAAGRGQARRFGYALREQGVPVATPVLASSLCRTRESAALAFGPARVRTEPALLGLARLVGPGGTATPAEREAALRALDALLEAPPPAGANRVIVAHSFPPGVGLGPLPEMGAVIVHPRGRGQGYDIVARVPLDAWASLPAR